MAKLTLTDIAAGFALITTFNANNALIEAALENTLSRDGTTPNTMSATLDMNSQIISNLPDGVANQSPVTVSQLAAASIVSNATTAVLTSLADAGGNYNAANVEAALLELASVTTGEGASIIGLEDASGSYTAADVEAALAELSATTGAGIIGLLDAAGFYTATDVEAALAEIFLGVTGSFTPTFTGFSADPSTPTVFWHKAGSVVTLRLNFSTGTSNATGFTITNLPAAVIPTSIQYPTIVGHHDNSANVTTVGQCIINTGGTMDFRPNADPNSVWTNSGAKGFNIGRTLMYSRGVLA